MCAQQELGSASGKFTVGGMNYSIDFTAAVFLDWGSELSGAGLDTLAATYLIESGGGNLSPLNNGNGNGSVDIGPMQLNYVVGSTRWPSNALGTNLLPKQPFNGNAFVNILEGADYLASLPDPGDYYSSTPSLMQQRDNALNALTPTLQPFFDCLQKP